MNISPSFVNSSAPSSFPIKAEEFQSQLLSFKTKALISEKELKKEKAFEKLEQLYLDLKTVKSVNTEVIQLLIPVLGRYGVRQYPNFKLAVSSLQASLHLQLSQLKILKSDEKVMEYADLQKIPDNEKFPDLFHFIRTTDSATYSKLLEALPLKSKMDFAETMLYLGYCYSNLGFSYTELSEKEHQQFLSQLYHGVKDILTSMEQTKEVLYQLGELQYNIFPGLYIDQCKLESKTISKEQVDEFCRILDLARLYNRSGAMEARIENLKGCRVRDHLQDLVKAKEHVKKSEELWEKELKDRGNLTPTEIEFYEGLQANVKNNLLSIMIKECDGIEKISRETWEKMEGLSCFCLDFYTKQKENHPYSMIHLLNLAKVETFKKNSEQAKTYLNEVIRLAEKEYSDWPPAQKYKQTALDEISKLSA